MVSNVVSNHIAGLYAANTSSSGKIPMPVDPAFLVYSHFKNVFGVPAPEGILGVGIDKLSMLNTLIEQMKQMNQMSGMDTEDFTGLFSSSDQEAVDIQPLIPSDRLDALINSYGTQIRSAIESQIMMPYTPNLPQAGIFFNFSV